MAKSIAAMRSEVLSEVKPFRTLEGVFEWAFARKPQAQLVEVVTQDEFTHDIIISLDEETFLVFDTN
jgi:hypothetical protein